MVDTQLQSKRVQAARRSLILDQPFWGMLALKLDLVCDPLCPTAWTDGKALGYNPVFVSTLTQAELIGLICHEVLHCACGHPWRRGNRDHKRFNIAADYAINPIVIESRMALPAGALIDPQYSGKYAEWIYDRLPESQQPQAQASTESGDGDGQSGETESDESGETESESGDGESEADATGQSGSSDSAVQHDQPTEQPGEVRDAPTGQDAPTEQEWREAVQQAIKVSEAYGKLPGGMARSIGQASAPKTDWRSALRRFVQETVASDYTWTRPNTRYLASGLFLPALHAQQCRKIVIGVDTSGSIDDVMLAQFSSEIQAIADEVQPGEIEAVYCDTRVDRVETFYRGDAVKLTPCGGGGTDFRPVFDHVEQSGDVPSVLIYLTDLEGCFPEMQPDCPVLWAYVKPWYRETVPAVPFGDVLAIE